jgi:hypothetical protein
MLLDYNLPSMNGFTVVKFVRDKVNDLNTKLEKVKVVIVEPEYVIYTAFYCSTLKTHFKKLKLEQVHEKPLHIGVLKSLLQTF